MDFAKALFNEDMTKRVSWLDDKLQAEVKKGKISVGKAKETMELIDFFDERVKLNESQ